MNPNLPRGHSLQGTRGSPPALGSGRRGLPVACVPRCALPIGRRRGGGPGLVHRGVL